MLGRKRRPAGQVVRAVPAVRAGLVGPAAPVQGGLPALRVRPKAEPPALQAVRLADPVDPGAARVAPALRGVLPAAREGLQGPVVRQAARLPEARPKPRSPTSLS